MMDLTVKEMRLLAECERDIDSGKRPFVLFAGNRMPISQELIEECGLVSGQTVSSHMMLTIMKMHRANLQSQTAIENMKKKARN